MPLSSIRQAWCVQCGSTFRKLCANAATCSEACRSKRKRTLDSAREQTRERRRPIGETLAVRLRCEAWARRNRNCTRQNHWLAGAPPYHVHLPGCAMTVHYSPLPRWPIELRNSPALHGALTAVLGAGHVPRIPNFSLVPHGSGWGVHWFRQEGMKLAGKSVHVPLFDRPTTLTFGPAWRFRSPAIQRRGRQLVRLDAITPIVIRSGGGASECVRPGAVNIASAIGVEFVRRLAPSEEWARYVAKRICVEIVSQDTHPETIPFGGKYGPVRGWSGSLVLEVNAVSRWLLEAAARIGFGGRTAFGCGRVIITDMML